MVDHVRTPTSATPANEVVIFTTLRCVIMCADMLPLNVRSTDDERIKALFVSKFDDIFMCMMFGYSSSHEASQGERTTVTQVPSTLYSIAGAPIATPFAICASPSSFDSNSGNLAGGVVVLRLQEEQHRRVRGQRAVEQEDQGARKTTKDGPWTIVMPIKVVESFDKLYVSLYVSRVSLFPLACCGPSFLVVAAPETKQKC